MQQLEQEQNNLKAELDKRSETFELNRRRIEEACSVVKLNEGRARAGELIDAKCSPTSPETIRHPGPLLPAEVKPSSHRINFKGVVLPTFSGEDKMEFEAWHAAFISVVDESNISVSRKDAEVAELFTRKGAGNGKRSWLL